MESPEIAKLRSRLETALSKADESLLHRKVNAFYNYKKEAEEIKNQIAKQEQIESIDPNQLSMF
jgi:phage shock protein A